jgi:hypothetical protein
MAVASVQDFALYLNLVDDIDVERAQLLLDLAEAKCSSIITPVPPEAAGVVMDVAARAYTNPNNTESVATGPYAVKYRGPAGGLWLTRDNLTELHRLGGSGGAYTIDPTPLDAGPYITYPPVLDPMLVDTWDYPP